MKTNVFQVKSSRVMHTVGGTGKCFSFQIFQWNLWPSHACRLAGCHRPPWNHHSVSKVLRQSCSDCLDPNVFPQIYPAVLATQMPQVSAPMKSPVVALTQVPSGPLACILSHKIRSANTIPCTIADLPFKRAYAVFLSWPTSNLDG